MRVEKFKCEKSQKVSQVIASNYPFISYNTIRKMLRNKDIKVNGKRLGQDAVVNFGDEIVFYFSDVEKPVLDVLYEDENIIVVFKKRKIETVSMINNNDLLSLVCDYVKSECFAVHRLDMNTEGIVVFAKNLTSKKSLDEAFKNRTLEKYYLAQVFGVLEKHEDKLVAFLKKNEKESRVMISDVMKKGYDKIQTNYKVLKNLNNSSLIEVELITGKTHQIRAHFAHIGHFVIGDEKYGESEINKIFKSKYQKLCAYKLIFHFNDSDSLFYLNNKVIEIDRNKIDFCQNL